MERIHRVVGPVATNVHVLADPASREAIAIDTATPSLAWIADELAARDWTLKLIVSTHGHWDHIGDNAAVAEHTGADIAVHPLDRDRLTDPQPLWAPFEIVPSVPAVDLAEGGVVRFGSIRLRVLHTPGHTEGSVCLLRPGRGPAVQRRHAVRGRLGPGRPAGRRSRRHGRVAGPPAHPRRRRAGVPGARRRDDDRPGTDVARARPRRRAPHCLAVSQPPASRRRPEPGPSRAGGSGRPRPASARTRAAASRR